MAIRITRTTSRRGRAGGPRNPMIMKVQEILLDHAGQREVTVDMMDVIEPHVAAALRRATNGELLASLSPAQRSVVLERTEALLEPTWKAFRSAVSNVSYRLKKRGVAHTTRQKVDHGVVMSAITFTMTTSGGQPVVAVSDVVAALEAVLPETDADDTDDVGDDADDAEAES